MTSLLLRRASGVVLPVLAATLLAGCGSGAGAVEQAGAAPTTATSASPSATPDADPDGGAQSKAPADGTPATVACPAQAKGIALPPGVSGVPLPGGTVLVSSGVRSGGRVVVTGVVPGSEKDVLTALQARFAKAGLRLTEGETEEHDAESNFEGNGITGRWGIRELDGCSSPATRIDLVVRPES